MKKLLSIFLFLTINLIGIFNPNVYAYEAKEVLKEQIQTERLILDGTPLKNDTDTLNILAKYLMNKDITRYLSVATTQGFDSIDQAKNFLSYDSIPNSKTFRTYTVKLKDSKLPIGQVDFIVFNDHTSEMGYWLGKDFQNKGFASEACIDLALKFFDSEDVQKFHIEFFPENTASANLSNKIMKNIQNNSAYNTVKTKVKNNDHGTLEDTLEKSTKKVTAEPKANNNNWILYGSIIFVAGCGVIIVIVWIYKKKKK